MNHSQQQIIIPMLEDKEAAAAECFQMPLQGNLNQFGIRYLYPLILTVGLTGNICNLFVYTHPFLQSSPTVRLLTAKAVANLGHLTSVLMSVLYYIRFPGQYVPVPTVPDWTFDVHWITLKYTLFANNFFSTLAVWLTVAATSENYILVAFPVAGRQWSTLRNSNLFISICIPLAAALHAFLLIYYTTNEIPCWYSVTYQRVIPDLVHCSRTKYAILPVFITASNGTAASDAEVEGGHQSTTTTFKMTEDPQLAYYFQTYQTVYFWLSSCLSILIPLSILLYCSIAIYSSLFCSKTTTRLSASQHKTANSSSSSSSQQQKECVVKLALATTTSHLLLETMQVPVFIGTAFQGSGLGDWVHQEALSAVGGCTSLLNSSVPFLLYLVFSRRFRMITLDRFGCKCPGLITPVLKLKRTSPHTHHAIY